MMPDTHHSIINIPKYFRNDIIRIRLCKNVAHRSYLYLLTPKSRTPMSAMDILSKDKNDIL